MPFYDIAGLVVEIKHPTGRTEKQARPYLCKDQEGQTADITIDVTEQRVTDAMAEHPEMTTGTICSPARIFTPSC